MKTHRMWLTMVLQILGWFSMPPLSQETKPPSGKDIHATVTFEQHRI